MADITTPDVVKSTEPSEDKTSKPQKVREFFSKIRNLRNREPRQALEEISKNTTHQEKPPELPEKVNLESVQEASQFLGELSLLDKSRRFLELASDKTLSLSPAIGASVGVMAINHLAGGPFSSEASILLTTLFAGGAAGIDGTKMKSELRNAFSAKQIGKNAALALLFTKGLEFSNIPLPTILANFADDAVLPFLRYLPMLSTKSGGIK